MYTCTYCLLPTEKFARTVIAFMCSMLMYLTTYYVYAMPIPKKEKKKNSTKAPTRKHCLLLLDFLSPNFIQLINFPRKLSDFRYSEKLNL